MKLIPVKYLGLFGLASLLGGLFHSCTTSWDNLSEEPDEKSEITLRTQLSNGTIANGLLTKLYVFSSNDAGDYLLSDSLPQIVDGASRLKLRLADLKKKNYRFLFVSTPQASPEIEVRRTDNSALLPGAEWKNIAIGMKADSLSIDNYYRIEEMTGNEILEEKVINADLTRLVGQMMFCFYKAGPGGVKDPVGIDDPNVASVMDRISSVHLTYEGTPRLITFDAQNQPVALSGSETILEHIIRFPLTTDSLKVHLKQGDIPVETYDSIPGSAIMKGTCLLPSQQKVRVKMEFHYYDTTPVCGNFEKTHTHGMDCYTPATLLLNLPQTTNSQGLSVLPDKYTVNNAGLPCNRVIDIQHTSGFDIDTEWK